VRNAADDSSYAVCGLEGAGFMRVLAIFGCKNAWNLRMVLYKIARDQRSA
jgi:hypothetical protein